MNVYRIEEFNKYDDSGLECDRVISFTLLRSNVYIYINGSDISIFQQPHVDGYATDDLVSFEQKFLDEEKNYISRWINANRENIEQGFSAENIIRYFSRNKTYQLNLDKKKPVITGIAYARKSIMDSVKLEKDRVVETLQLKDASDDERNYYFNLFGVTNPTGTDTIRFYVKNKNNTSNITSADYVDVNIDSSRIVDVISHIDGLDTDSIVYFCSRYFDLLSKHEPVEVIALLDNCDTIDFIPSNFKVNV